MNRASRILTRGKSATIATGAAIVAALALPSAASAATVSLTGGVATFAATAGEANHVTVSRVSGYLLFDDSGVTSMTAGAGCSPAGTQKVACPELGVTAISADLGDGNDYLYEYTTFYGVSLPTTVFAGAGTDYVRTSGGADTISGGAGADNLGGGGGDDTIDGNEGADVVSGGSGTDTVTYSTRTAPVTVTLADGLANDGEAGEGDKLDATVEVVDGGDGDDHLTGGDAANELVGGAGADTLAGAGGDDLLDGGSGVDSYDGGAGVDTLKARDGEVETVACGSEADSVEADYDDVVGADCETVDRSSPPPVVDPPPVVLPPPPTGNGNPVEPPVASIADGPAKVSGDGVVAVKLACPRDAFEGCAGTIEIKLLTGKGKTQSAKPASARAIAFRRRPPRRRHFKIAAGKTKTIRVSLNRRAYHKFKKRRHLKVQITVTMKNATGTTTTTHVVALRRTPKKPTKPKQHR
jgi:hypothetical protein